MKITSRSVFCLAPLSVLSLALLESVPAVSTEFEGSWVRVSNRQSWFLIPGKSPIPSKGEGALDGKVFGVVLTDSNCVYYTREGFGFGKAEMQGKRLVVKDTGENVPLSRVPRATPGTVVLGASPSSRDLVRVGPSIPGTKRSDRLFINEASNSYKEKTISLSVDEGAVFTHPKLTKVAFSTRSLSGGQANPKGFDSGVYVYDFAKKTTKWLCGGVLLSVNFNTDTYYIDPDVTLNKKDVFAFKAAEGTMHAMPWNASIFLKADKPAVIDESKNLAAVRFLESRVVPREPLSGLPKDTVVYNVSKAQSLFTSRGNRKVMACGLDIIDLTTGVRYPHCRTLFDAPAYGNPTVPWFRHH